MKQYQTVKCFTDGSTVGHNGKLGTVKEVGLGIFITDNNNKNIRISKKVKGISNNESEFKALILAMETCIEKNLLNVHFYLDSQIVVNRANGKRPKKKYANARMDAFQDKVFVLSEKMNWVLFEWIPREKNEVADLLANIPLNKD